MEYHLNIQRKKNSKLKSLSIPSALTKMLGEELVIHFSKVYNLNQIQGYIYLQKIANRPFTIVGDGKQTRDFTFVSDVVDALIKVGNKRNLIGEILNVGSGRTVSVNKITELLKGKKNQNSEKTRRTRRYICLYKKLKEKLDGDLEYL